MSIGRNEVTSPYAVLAQLPPDLPQQEMLTHLLEGLVSVTEAVRAELWLAAEGGFVISTGWPAVAGRSVDADPTDLPSLAALEGVDALARVEDGGTVRAVITLTLPAAGGSTQQLSAPDQQWLRDTGHCVLAALRIGELRRAVSAQTRHTARLAEKLADSHRRLATVRDLERRRVAGDIIALSTERFGGLHEQVAFLGEHLDSLSGHPEATTPLRDLLDELIEDFRVMVRGIQPITLQLKGPRAALIEAAAGLRRPVGITGDVPARVDHEIGTTIYYLTMTALQTLAGTDREHTLEVLLSHADGRLGVLVTGRTGLPASMVRAALVVDADRLAALDGGVEVMMDEENVIVRAWLPDRLEPRWHPQPEQPAGLSDRIRSLALALARRYGDGAGSARIQVLLARLDGPVQVAVHGLKDHLNALILLGRRFPNLVLLLDPQVGSHVSAEIPDVVLRPSLETRTDRVDLSLPGAGALVCRATWDDLPHLLSTEVLARADLLRARSVMAALATLLRREPVAGDDAARFEYRLERLEAGARELAELTALTQLRSSRRGLTRAQLRAGERLLGAGGSLAHERLGLPPNASDTQLHQAAGEAISSWRRLEQNSTDRNSRAAFGVVVRTCEMLLTRTLGDPLSDRNESFDLGAGS